MQRVPRIRSVRGGSAHADPPRRHHGAGRPSDRHLSTQELHARFIGHAPSRERLDSWKEIASHLRRTVRTVQRWEDLGLPVYRHEHVAGSSVYAFRTELDRWWNTRRPSDERDDAAVARAAASPDMPLIAVLPFTDLGAESDGPYFCEGFVDELITTLASVEGISVISRTSVMQFRDRLSISLERIATLLSATLLVEGALHRLGDQVLVTVRLVDPFDAGRVLWGQRYGCLHPEVRQLQAQVASDIAQHAVRADDETERAAPQSAERVNPDAHDAYLMGRFYLCKRAAAALLTALERFNQAIAFDPSDARGYSGLAEAYVLLSGNEFWAPEAGFPKAREAANRALERDPRNAAAHAALGMVKALYEWNWDEAAREFDTAIELNPSYAEAWHWRGIVRLMTGQIAQSIPPLEHAFELDPLSPIIVVNSGRPLHFLEQYDEAISRCNYALTFAPGFWLAHINRAFAYSAQGDGPRAIEAARAAVEFSKGNGAAVLALAEAHAVAGDQASALAVVDRVTAAREQPGASYVSAFRVARVFARLGDREQAFDWLQQSVQERSLGNSTYVPLDPALDPLRDDVRFSEVLGALHLA